MKKLVLSVMALSAGILYGQQTVDFEELTFESGQNFWNGSDGSGMFQSQQLTFSNSYTPDWSSWSGFAYSKDTDVTTAGYQNQYSAFTGSGDASVNYAVWYSDGVITFDEPSEVSTISVTNTTYAALSMRDGDGYAKQFGSTTNAGGDVDGTNGEDWLRLIVYGWNTANEMTDSVIFYLADYRFENDVEDYIVDTWEQIDLSSLGIVSKLTFKMQSTDVGEYGMNTPAYFALDNIEYEVVNSASVSGNEIAEFSIFPNPATTSFTVVTESEVPSGAQLLTLSGQVIYKFETVVSGMKVDVSGLDSGIYVFQMDNTVKRIVVQ